MVQEGGEPDSQQFKRALTQHLAQPVLDVVAAGPLHGRGGARIGYMVLLEAESFDLAESFLGDCPYLAADLYERVELAEYAIQTGRIH